MRTFETAAYIGRQSDINDRWLASDRKPDLLEHLGDPRSFGQTGAVKYANGQPIDDRAREREILQDVAGAWKPDLTRRPEYSSSRSDRGQQGNSRNLNP
jgi:hypothetical protein